jgi:hypothetical protein
VVTEVLELHLRFRARQLLTQVVVVVVGTTTEHQELVAQVAAEMGLLVPILGVEMVLREPLTEAVVAVVQETPIA